jgi:hypothetical protein
MVISHRGRNPMLPPTCRDRRKPLLITPSMLLPTALRKLMLKPSSRLVFLLPPAPTGARANAALPPSCLPPLGASAAFRPLTWFVTAVTRSGAGAVVATATDSSSAPCLLRVAAKPLSPAATRLQLAMSASLFLFLSMPPSHVSLGHFLLLLRLNRVMLLVCPGSLLRWPRHRPSCSSSWDDNERSCKPLASGNIVYQDKTEV